MKPSSYNLIMSAMFNGRRGERPPVGNPTSIVCHGLMDAAGVSFPHAHLDPNAMAELALAGHENAPAADAGDRRICPGPISGGRQYCRTGGSCHRQSGGSLPL